MRTCHFLWCFDGKEQIVSNDVTCNAFASIALLYFLESSFLATLIQQVFLS
jgi:hypothetical protein